MNIDALLKHLADFGAEPNTAHLSSGFVPTPPPDNPYRVTQETAQLVLRPVAPRNPAEESLAPKLALLSNPLEASLNDLASSPREIEDRISAARDEGRREALNVARREYEAKISEIERAHEESFEARQSEWRRQLEASIGDRVEQAIGGLERELAEAVALVLKPLATRRQGEAILEKFCATVREILSGGVGAGLVIEAPAEFVDSIAIRSLCEGHFLDVRPSRGTDIIARVDASVVRARFAEWGADVAEQLRSAA